MRTLSRYLAKRFLGLFVAIFLAATVTVAVVEMLLNFDQILKAGEGVSGYLLLRIPSYYLTEILQLSAFGASFVTLALSAQWREMLAMRAGGLSPHRATLPVLGVAACLTLASFVVGETVVREAQRGWRHNKTHQAELLQFGRGSFWYHGGQLVYNITEADRETRELRGVRAYELDPQGRLLVRTLARRAVWLGADGDGTSGQSGQWALQNATVHHFDPAHPEWPTVVEFVDQKVLPLAGHRDRALAQADIESLDLWRTLVALRAREREGEPTAALEAGLHARLSNPLGLLLFALIGVPLGARARDPRSTGRLALAGVGSLALFFALRNVVLAVGREAVWPPALGPWLLLAAFAAAGAWQLSRMDR